MNQAILQKIINARKILVLDYPFWGNLALRLTLKEDPTCKRGWTDGKILGYNPDWISKITDTETVGWCAHEIGHPMCQHHTRRGGRNKSLWNRAGDYVINAILKQENFDLPGRPLLDPRFNGMNTDDVFKILETEREEIREKFKELQKKTQEGGGNGESNTDESIAESGDSSTDNEQDDNKDEDSGGSSDDGENNEEDTENNEGDLDEDKNNSDDNIDDENEDKGEGDNEGQDDEGQDDEGQDDEGQDDEGQDDEGQDDEENENSLGPHDELDPDLFDDDEDPGGCGEVRDFPGPEPYDKATPADLKQEEQEQKIAVTQAANQAERMGNMPEGLDREIKELVKPKVDPRDLLQQFVAMSAKNDFAWTPPSRKYICQGLYLPSLKSEELGTVVLVLDTSISIHQKELDQFSSIVSAILETYIIDAVVLYCDTEVYEPEYFKKEDLPLDLKMKGGGGTDFRGPFKFIEDNNIDLVCLIYLTDLECDKYPEYEPDYPVMWISTVPENRLWYGLPPWGEVIYIDLEE
jgi:predicted metal-dependent peptidase